MLRNFDLNKVIFLITDKDVVIDNLSVKVYLNYDPSLPIGRVRLFKKGDKIYGRIKYYTNLEAYKSFEGKLGKLFPSLAIVKIGNGKWKIKNAFLSNYKRLSNENLECLGKQLLRRKLAAVGLMCFRENKNLISICINPKSKRPFISMVYMAMATPAHLVEAEMLIDRKTYTPVSILYKLEDSAHKNLFYLDQL